MGPITNFTWGLVIDNETPVYYTFTDSFTCSNTLSINDKGPIEFVTLNKVIISDTSST